MPQGAIPRAGSRFTQPDLADTLTLLTLEGLDGFYRGSLAERFAQQMTLAGMPLTIDDLANYRARRTTPLRLQHSKGDIYNLAPPTQGLVSLAILGLTDHLAMADLSDSQTVHRIVEATKLAFGLRDRFITDPRMMTQDVQALLAPDKLGIMAHRIDTAAPRRGTQAKTPAIRSGWGYATAAGFASLLFRASTTNSAAAWYCREPGCYGRIAAPLSALTPTICWRWNPANSRSIP